MGQEGVEPTLSGFSDQRSYQTELPRYVAGDDGFEPPVRESKSRALPLGYIPVINKVRFLLA